MSYYNIIAQTTESTVVTEYKSNSTRADAYQSEAELEKEFIRLTYLGYRYALKAVKREFNIGKMERLLLDGGLN